MEKNACTFRLSILLTNRGERFVRGPNVILCSPVFNASTEASGGFSRPFGSATIGPLGGSCSISAIHFTANRVSPTSKEDPLADYIVSGGQLRKLDDALQGSVFIGRSHYHQACHRDHRLFIGGICAHPALWT